MGGLDQALLLTDDEWRNLDTLDPKIWMALSCPTEGLEFDAQTLAILDTDGDGRIRTADIISATKWICERVRHPAQFNNGGALALDNLRDDTAAGAAVEAAARLALESGTNEGHISVKEASAAVAKATAYSFNGDGILPADSLEGLDNTQDNNAFPENVPPAHVAEFIRHALGVVGGKKDASGKPGIDDTLAGEFRARLGAAQAWRKKVQSLDLPLGESTGEAWDLIQRLRHKIDDYFARCHLAYFAPQTLDRLNEDGQLSGDAPASEESSPFSPQRLANMPLARIALPKTGEKAVTLPLSGSINPAWANDVTNFARLITPLFSKNSASAPANGQMTELCEDQWQTLLERFGPYASTLEEEPRYPQPPADAERVVWPNTPVLALAGASDPLGRTFLPTDPAAAITSLSDAELGQMLDENLFKAFKSWTAKDLAAPSLDALRDLEKLTLLQANFYTLLMNFVSFADFYDPQKRAIFQAGTLYLDSRACFLCVPVQDLESHVLLAAPSHLCLIYCQCQRRAADGVQQEAGIAAALTAGSAAALMDGRHGLFVDNAGRDWDTRIARIIHNPVSLREAVWAPYIRFAAIIGEQIHKFVASKEEAVGNATGQLAGNIVSTATAPKAPAPASAPPAPEAKGGFDFAKGAGIFAALSVALSVLSAAFAYIAKSVASLGWWWPVALIGIFACISGPSVLLAWFKLRKRSLGPLLDASGWAVNNGAPINMIMGAALTATGIMPHGCHRNLDDPYGLPAQIKRGRRWLRFWVWTVLLIIIAVLCLAIYCRVIGVPAWLTHLAGYAHWKI